MSEQLLTRNEYSRSMEDAEKYQAITTLTELGLLVPVTQIETYHGRVRTSPEDVEWEVDPGFANGSNDSGNNNVNLRPTLYTGEKTVAQAFAQERGSELIKPRYRKVFENRVEQYTESERQAWLERENYAYQRWYDGISPEDKHLYAYLLDRDGKLKLKTVDDLLGWREAQRLEKTLSVEERSLIWNEVAAGLRAEVHEIVTADSDATVLDLGFDDSKLDAKNVKRYNDALNVLFRQTPITEGSPVDFKDRHALKPFVDALKTLNGTVISDNDVATIAQKAGIDERVALQLTSAYNAGQIARIKPSYLVSSLLKHKQDIFVDTLDIGGEKEEIPINLEYVQRYMHNAHIVGVKQRVSSATLGRSITSVSFLDLEKTTTERHLTSERRATWKKLGSMARLLYEINKNNESDDNYSLLNLLSDAHVKPQKIVAAAANIEGYDRIFASPIGTWEGYSLAEHTETVLRNFDENYADKIPVELLSPMRLAIVAHDIGTPQAVAEGMKRHKKKYNVAAANDFLAKAGVDRKMRYLLTAMIGDGAELAHRMNIQKGGSVAEAAMREFATRIVHNLNTDKVVSGAQIESFSEMCKMLQLCDGAAYTSMAITRSTRTAGRYRNAPSFNDSYEQPLDYGKRKQKLRDTGKQSAVRDLTPQGKEPVSRIRISHKGAGRKPPAL